MPTGMAFCYLGLPGQLNMRRRLPRPAVCRFSDKIKAGKLGFGRGKVYNCKALALRMGRTVHESRGDKTMQSNWNRWTLLLLMTSMLGCAESIDVTVKTSDEDGAVTELVTTTPTDRGGVAQEIDKTELKNKEVIPLSIGDAAPPLQIASWVKGEPVQKYEAGHIYIVEFWATWCGPCKVSMPHISELQQEHADSITVVGVTDESDATVNAFLDKEQSEGKTWDEIVQYRLASEGEDRPMTSAFMRAASQTGIPTAFIVGRSGIVEWIGHPMRIDEPIQELLANTWDRDEFQESYERIQAERRAIAAVRPELSSARQAEDWDAALQIIDDLEQKIGFKPVGNMKASFLLNAERFAECQECLRKTAELSWDDASVLNSVAWTAATELPATDRDLAWALDVANRADELEMGEDGMILDTVARIHFELGDIQEAISWQRRAVEQQPGNTSLTEALELYLKADSEPQVEATEEPSEVAETEITAETESTAEADGEAESDGPLESDGEPEVGSADDNDN